TDAHGPISSARHSSDSDAISRCSTAALIVLACGSSDTVMLVSEVDTRSTDRTCALKIWKTSARKPTSCHMPGLSIETSVMPRFTHTAFTLAEVSAGEPEMRVPAQSGTCVA